MSTVAEPIRFRCFQCNKLLGVSRSKAGAVVACPQCSAELVVPEPADPAAPAPAAAASWNPIPKPTETSNSSSSSRIEPVVVLWDATPSSDSSADAAQAFPAIQFEPVSLRSEPAARSRPSTRAAKPSSRDDSEVVVVAVDVAAALALPKAVVASPSAGQVIMPVLAVEAPSLREEPPLRGGPGMSLARERSARRDDLVLPRIAVILWSFLVLLALVFAFAAGLLAGRFLWARGVPISVSKPVAVYGKESPRIAIEGFPAEDADRKRTRILPPKLRRVSAISTGNSAMEVRQFPCGRENPIASSGGREV